MTVANVTSCKRGGCVRNEMYWQASLPNCRCQRSGSSLHCHASMIIATCFRSDAFTRCRCFMYQTSIDAIWKDRLCVSRADNSSRSLGDFVSQFRHGRIVGQKTVATLRLCSISQSQHVSVKLDYRVAVLLFHDGKTRHMYY